MKNLLLISLCLAGCTAFAQVQMNKAIQLTGSGSDAKIEGIQEVVNDNDAASKKYVDTTLANLLGVSTLTYSLSTDVDTIEGAVGLSTASTPVAVTISYTGGAGDFIGLSTSGLPSGVTANFSPSAGSPTFGSTLYFNIGSGVAPGTYPVSIEGNGGVGNPSTILYLVIIPTKLVFLSSSTHMGNFGGVAAADAICQGLASGAGLGGTYKAWLSGNSSASSPSNTFTQSSGPYYLVDGSRVADNWADLVDGEIQHKINIDENGTTYSSGWYAWTNTGISGDVHSTTTLCNDWTGLSGDGYSGDMNRSDNDWTRASWVPCNWSERFYCFQQ